MRIWEDSIPAHLRFRSMIIFVGSDYETRRRMQMGLAPRLLRDRVFLVGGFICFQVRVSLSLVALWAAAPVLVLELG